MFESFRHLEPKDWVTLIGTAIALIFSTASLLQKHFEGKLAVRKQLSDILIKLSELNLLITKARVSEEETGKPDRTVGPLSDQRRYLVRQAAFLADRLGDDVSTYEYLMIAAAFDAADDTWQAESYFRRATTTKSADPISAGLARRALARFLYHEGDKEAGRAMYREAVATFGSQGDRARFYRGQTFERWAGQEAEWGNPAEEKELMQFALAEYQNVINPFSRTKHLGRLVAVDTRTASKPAG